MLGLMQDWPLLCTSIIDHAATQHGDREVISRSVEGPIHRTTLRRSAPAPGGSPSASTADGIRLGDRVATLAWNTWRHLEVWYGLLGLGAIYHTVNPRLFPDQIAWIINHAEDRVLFVDLTFLPILEKLAPTSWEPIEKLVVLTDAAHMPATSLERGALRGMARRGRRRFRLGSSTRTPPPACATPPAPPAIRRASSTRIAPTCCIR